MSYFCSRASPPIPLKHSKACILLFHILRHYRSAPDVTVALTRQNPPFTVRKTIDYMFYRYWYVSVDVQQSKSHAAGVLDPRGILTVYNITIKNKNNNNNRTSPSKSLKIISYSCDRLMRSHFGNTAPNRFRQVRSLFSLFYKRSSTCSRAFNSQICVGICIAQKFAYKKCRLYGYWLRVYTIQWKT